MSKLLIIKRYIFLIYSIDLAEKRKHIHVESRKGRFRRTAKFWLEPKIELVESGDFGKHEIEEIRKLIIQNIELLNEQIGKFSKGQKVRTIKIK